MKTSNADCQDALSLRQCPVCGSPEYDPLFQVPAAPCYPKLYGVSNGRVVTCRSCGLSHTNPMLSECLDADQYINSEIGYGRLNDAAFTLYWEDQLLCFYELLEQMTSRDASILDFACGKGGFVFLCERQKLTAKGIDLSYPCIEAGRKHGVNNIYCSDLRDEPDSCYDIVVALHVLEHCRDIQPLADEFKRVLKPEGKVFIMVPNYGSASFRLKPKRYWNSVYMHVNGLTARHLDRVFVRRDFRRIPLQCSYSARRISEITTKVELSMKLTKYFGNFLNVFPTKLFCIYQRW